MKRACNLACLLLLIIGNACTASTPVPTETPRIVTATPVPTHTSIPHVAETALPHDGHTPVPTETPPQPVTFSSDLAPNQVRVDAGITYQTIDGFGATHISLMYEGVGSSISPELRAQAVDAIYRQVGINLGNLEGGLLESPGSYDQRSNDNDDPAVFNWAGFQTFGADAIQSDLLALAQPLGFDDYYLGQRVNVRWASPWLADLRATNYTLYLDEVAEQVAAGCIYWRDQFGIVPRYLMLFNEPLSGNGELLSQNGSPQEITDLVKAVGLRLEREGFDNIRFVLPNEETVTQTLETVAAVLADPDARRFVGPIGYHSYPYESPYANIPSLLSSSGSGTPNPQAVADRDKLRRLSEQFGLPLWMTEVSNGDVDPTSFDDFRGRAIHIHDEFVFAHASAYFGMNNMWDTASQEMHFGDRSLFNYGNEGNILLIDNDQNKVHITGMGYAIGHYARWVKPGSIRVDAQTGDPLLQVTAFVSPESDRIVIVLINNNKAPKEVQLEINSANLSGSASGEQSFGGQYWEPLPEIQIAGQDGFEITVPAESVTTLILPIEQN